MNTYEIIRKALGLMLPSRARDGFAFQVERDRDMNDLRSNETGFVITSPTKHFLQMFEKDGVVWVGYKGAATWDEQSATDQEKARDLLEKVCRPGATTGTPHFDIWTIKLGTGLTKVTDFIQEFKKLGCEMSDYAEKVLAESDLVVAPQEIEVKLAVISGTQLGFTSQASRQDIYDRASRFGLGICPSEVGLQLRKQRTNQPADECLIVAMEPLRGSGYSIGLILKRHGEGKQRLNTTEITSNDLWDPEELWVFLQRENCES